MNIKNSERWKLKEHTLCDRGTDSCLISHAKGCNARGLNV